MKADPELAMAFATYMQCRTLQLFTMEIPKGSGRDQKIIKKVITFPNGYHTLPWAGGMLDQPYRMMEFFDIFMSVERRVAFDNLK